MRLTEREKAMFAIPDASILAAMSVVLGGLNLIAWQWALSHLARRQESDE